VVYFVTGATGFVGGEIVAQLLAGGHHVRALVRNPAAGRHLAAAGATLHQGDVTDQSSMRTPMAGVDGVFHVAGWYKLGIRDRNSAISTNISGTRNVLELMRELLIPRGVYTSTLAVNSDTHGKIVTEDYRFAGRHLSLYDWSKAEAHRIALKFIADGLPLTIVQPGLVYGPRDTSGVRTTLIQYLKRKLPAVPSRAAYAWAHVEDISRGHLLAMEHGKPGRSYFLAGPVHTLIAALAVAESFTGIKAPRIHVPPGVFKAASAVMRMVDPVVSLPPSLSPESLRVLAGVTYVGSAKRAREELGWRARPLREGLMDTLRHEMRLLGMTPRF